MGMKIYHQVGHNSKWSIDSFAKDGCGDGLILSPVHQGLAHVKRLSQDVRRQSLFDPQYYLPNSQKTRLASYPFFPEQISDGFSTGEFPLVAMDSAEQCVEFQIEQDFEGIVIPTRFVDQMRSNYFEAQEAYTVVPFVKAINKAGVEKPVYLTVAITSAMLLDDEFQTRLLNWMTGFPEISGVYVLLGDDRKTKQIANKELLSAYLSFAHELIASRLQVVLGHLNTESILLSILDDVTLTFGSFENTRIFSLDKFIENEEERRGPKARILLPALLNWVQFGHAMQIKEDAPELWANVYTPSGYAEKAIAAAAEPHFTQPELYKHHFVCMSEEIHSLARLPVADRYVVIRDKIKTAIDLHKQIGDMPLELDPHGNGDHLPAWLDSLNSYYRKYLKA